MTQRAVATSDPPQTSRYRFVIAGLVLLAHFSLGLNLFSITPLLLEVIRHYSINSSTAGLLVSLALLVAAGFGLPGSVITMRLGLTRAFGAGWWLIGLITLSALSPNFLTLLALRLSFGLGFALVLTATGPILLQWFRKKEILVMNALNTATLSLGITVSISTAAPLASEFGWQNTLSIFGAIGVLGAVAWVFLGKDSAGAFRVASSISMAGILRIIRRRAILLLLAADAGVLIQYTALTAWLPTFYFETRGMTAAQAGFATGLLPFVGIFAVLLGGFLPLRIGSPKSYFIIPGLLVAIGGPGAFILGSPTGIYLSLILVGIGSWLYVPTLLSRSMELVGMDPHDVAIVWGSLITFSGLAMFIAPIIVGAVRDISGSFFLGFVFCSIAALTLLAAGVAMPKGTSR